MNELSHLAMESPSLAVSIVLTFIGMLVYWLIVIKKKKSEKGERFRMAYFIETNFLDIVISLCAAVGIFIAGYSSDTLTMERCLLMGVTVSFLVNKLVGIAKS